MIGYWHGKHYIEPPVDDPRDIELYKTHVTNGTVPKKGIPYTTQSRVRRAALFPSSWYATNPKMYIREFERLNNLKEIPQ